MTNNQIISWIFLAIALGSQKEAINYQSISNIADGINHAIPTQKELQIATKWLLEKDLISKQNKKYRLTTKGSKLHEVVSSKNNTIMALWHAFEKELFA